MAFSLSSLIKGSLVQFNMMSKQWGNFHIWIKTTRSEAKFLQIFKIK